MHPDKNPGADATEAFDALKQAHRLLKDPGELVRAPCSLRWQERALQLGVKIWCPTALCLQLCSTPLRAVEQQKRVTRTRHSRHNNSRRQPHGRRRRS